MATCASARHGLCLLLALLPVGASAQERTVGASAQERTVGASAQERASATDSALAVLGRFVEQERSGKAIPGSALALVLDGRLAWARGFGWADSAAGVTMSARTPVRVRDLPASLRMVLTDSTRRAPGLADADAARELPGSVTGPPARGTLWLLDGRRLPVPERVRSWLPLGGPDVQETMASASRLALAAAAAGERGRSPTGAGLDRSVGHDRGINVSAGPVDPWVAPLLSGTGPGIAVSVGPVVGGGVVAVVATLDAATGITRRIAAEAARLLAAARAGRPLLPPDTTSALPPGQAIRLNGRYGPAHPAARVGVRPGEPVRLEEYQGSLFLTRPGQVRAEVRASADGSLLTDDVADHGTRVQPLRDGLVIIGRDTLRRWPDRRPAPAPATYEALIGEYGREEDGLGILERDGRLAVLIDRLREYPLVRRGSDAYELRIGARRVPFRFLRPGRGGRSSALVVNADTLPRRLPAGPASFRIVPLRPVGELRREALAAAPPAEAGDFRAPELVELQTLASNIRYDIRYATPDNFMGAPMYSSAHAFLQRPAAEAVARAAAQLRLLGYGLLIHDAYRPWYVTRMFWDATPPAQRAYVADPSRGSRHNRGCAVDLTLYELATGRPVHMTGGYDEMSARSHPRYPGGSSSQRWHRDLLRRVMEAQGFTVYEVEWWHFDHRDWRRYPIMNSSFEELAGSPRSSS